MENIKIITINTWKCDGDYRKRMRALAEGLRFLKPAIIACQECFVCEHANTHTLQFLAEELNMNYIFTPGRSKKRYFEGAWVDSLSGLGILSVYPVKVYDAFSLPATPEDDDRKALQALISLPSGRDLLVINLHLTHLKNIPLRRAQAEYVANRTAQITDGYYKLVCGDFNAEAGSDEMGAFINNCNAMDAYLLGGGTEHRCSLLEARDAGKNVCVDHIFALPGKDGKYPRFVDSEMVLNKPGSNGVYPSDHFGISTTLITD